MLAALDAADVARVAVDVCGELANAQPLCQADCPDCFPVQSALHSATLSKQVAVCLAELRTYIEKTWQVNVFPQHFGSPMCIPLGREGSNVLRHSASSVWPVIKAEQLRDARQRAGYTSQAALAEALGVSLRTVTAWEAEGGQVSARSEARVRALLWPSPEPLSHYSDFELLSEIGRRLDRIRAREDASQDPVYELNANVGQISAETNLSDRPAPTKPPRSSWGRGPRPRGDRTLNEENDANR